MGEYKSPLDFNPDALFERFNARERLLESALNFTKLTLNAIEDCHVSEGEVMQSLAKNAAVAIAALLERK